MSGPTSAPGLSLAECYRELGLHRQASPDEVKRAYRRQLMQCHPDLNGGDHSMQERFDRVQRAYRALESRRKGIHLHGKSRREHVEEAMAERAAKPEEEISVPPGENAYLQWRRCGFLATLSAAITGGMLLNRGAGGEPRWSYYDLYIAAIAAGGAMWGIGLGILIPFRERKGKQAGAEFKS